MIRFLLVGVWTLVVTLGATYLGAMLQLRKASEPVEAHAAKLKVFKVKPVTVPMIVDGALKGYVSADLSFVREAPENDKHGEGGAIDPESFIMEETFRLIYSEHKVDFNHIEKVDVGTLTKQIAERVNARLAGSPIKEILIKGLFFVPKDEIPR